MRIYLILSTLIFLNFTTTSQTFEKFYSTPNDELVYDAILIDSISIVFALNKGDHWTDSYTTTLYKMNSLSGEFTDSLTVDPSIPNSIFRGVFDMLKINDTLFAGIGKSWTDINEESQYIVHFTHNLQLVFDTIVNIEGINERLQKTIIADNILVSGGMEVDSGFKVLVEKTTKGELIQFKKYSYPTSMTITALVDIPAVNKYHIYVYLGYQHAYSIIDKQTLDSDTTFQYPLLFYPIDATMDPWNNNNYYVAGKQKNSSTFQNDLSFLKVNVCGEFEQFIYPTDQNIFYTYKCLAQNENSIYFGGVYPFTQQPPTLYPEPRWIMLFKLNNNGDIIWQNFYKGDVNYMVYKIIATPDGGALCFSTRYDWNDPIPNQRDVHILKIDSTGYYSPITDTEEVVEQPSQVLVYPNPVKDKLHFVFGLYSDLTISIYDASGREMISDMYHRSPTLDLTGFKKGLYLYRITGAKGLIEKGKIIKE